ncbi:MAG: hypothetical protein QMB62_06955, partial [Oscillospiraceae bacterium]
MKSEKIKTKSKRGKKIMLILGIIAALIAVCMIIGAILHSTYFKHRLEQIEPYGALVDTYDGQMHVYSIGSGDKTIVLLPGTGA